MYRARRRRLLSGVALALLVGYSAGQGLSGTGHVRVAAARTRADYRSPYTPAISWPPQGQAALVLGDGRPAASPEEQPVPIASLAKVMTAYLVLGQGQGSDTQAILAAAGAAAQQLVQSAVPTSATRTPAAPSPAGAPIGPAA